MKPRYEYVPESEWKPVKKALTSLLQALCDYVYERTGVRLRFRFVGSSNRFGSCFITRVRDGNKGFDFDVNLYVERPSKTEFWKARWIRNEILKACQIVFRGVGCKSPEDRTSVIRVKFLDKSSRTILHFCDLAIFQDLGDGEGFKYCRKYEYGGYGWVLRGRNSHDAKEKLSWLRRYESNWYDLLREEYLWLKNANQDESKASFQLFDEAVANVYSQVCQDIDD